MTFSNPSSGAADAGARYTRALLDLLGDREPLGVLAELVPWVERTVAGLDDARLRRPEAPGKWSVIEVLAHLADSDAVFVWRVRSVLTADRPPITGYDQDAWAAAGRYRERPLDEVLAQLRALRAANLRLYRSLGADELARVGLHAERGPESIGRMIELQAAHDLVHRRQIGRILG